MIDQFLKFLLCIVLCQIGLQTPLFAESMPRTIVALYDSQYDTAIHVTGLHRQAEMPLNHLGYRLEYHDIRSGLPNLQVRSDVIGVITWFASNELVPSPQGYLRWAIQLMDAGKKFAVIGNPGFYPEGNQIALSAEIAQFWHRLGVRESGRFITRTYDLQMIVDAKVGEFERRYKGILPGFRELYPLSPTTKTHVSARRKGKKEPDACLVFTSPRGGYAAEQYALYEQFVRGTEYVFWYLNPFEFFRLIFDGQDLPKPDTSTIAGRRIYYSHIDGDGWNSLTQREEYRNDPLLCAEVIYKDVLLTFPDLPCTVAPIGADVNLDWVGTEKSREVARKILALPHVEVGCHTYTHPFDWSFFENYTPQKEEPYLDRYPEGGWLHPNLFNRLKGRLTKDSASEGQPFDEDYIIPRAYALRPFNLQLEVEGAVKETNALSALDKPVTVYQWSGNCLAFEEALRRVRMTGIKNLNGGTTRLDNEYASYAYVSPLGRPVGKEQQIYSSNSNENTYTNLWMGKYFGFNMLPQTFTNTETPLRIRPMNLYYHLYSGERRASFQALLSNIAYIRSHEIAPIPMSHFAGIVEGFYSCEIAQIASDRWQIHHRGQLQTIRFDYATLRQVDFAHSRGVIGQRHFQGSLYIYLDEAQIDPIVTLKKADLSGSEPAAQAPYLIDSRWLVREFIVEGDRVRFIARGFGPGEMRFRVPEKTSYFVQIGDEAPVEIPVAEGILEFVIPPKETALPTAVSLGPKRAEI